MSWRKPRKVLFIFLTAVGILLLSAVGISRTKWFKKQIEMGLQETAEKHGLNLTIDSIEGALPFQWKLSNVALEKPGELSVCITEIKVRFAFIPLLKKQIAISYLKASEAKLILHMATPSLRGEIEASVLLQGEKLQMDFQAKDALAGPIQLDNWKNSIIAVKNETVWHGGWSSEAISGGARAQFHTDLLFDEEKQSLIFDDIELKGPSLSFGGDLAIDLAPFNICGDLRWTAEDLKGLRPFLPSSQLGGSCGGFFHFADHRVVQVLASDLEWRGVHIGSATLFADLSGSYENPCGRFECEAERVYFTNAYFSSFSLCGASDGEGWPMTLETKGTWQYPFQFVAKGKYQQNDACQTFTLSTIEGNLFEQIVQLKDPLQIRWSQSGVSFDPLDVKIGEGVFQASFSKNGSDLAIALHGERLPLSWMAMYTPYLSLQGDASLDGHLTASAETITGSCRLDISRFQAIKRGESIPFYARGSIEAHLASNTLQINSHLQASEEQVMMTHLTLPVDYTAPYHLRIATDRQISGALDVEGKLEELFHFANTGSQTLNGWAAGKILLYGTWENPELQGAFTLEQASYENHRVGFGLYDVSATLHAEKDKFIIDHFSASDGEKGHLTAQGEITLNAVRHYPYRFTGAFEHFDAIELDLVQAKLSGPASLEGNFLEARLQGTFIVDEARVAIPKSLPSDLPDLPYTFIDENTAISSAKKTGFPFSIDATFSSADTIAFEGNGLVSTWGGNLHLHGVNLNLVASGALRLSKGQFQILGKTFVLQQGELTFSDKPGQEGYLNLSGTLSVSDATITAQLRGPLSSPQLAFYSMPALTTNEIFSLLLFNKRVNEIKPVQAVQLAHTLLTFYGHTGWNPVSQIGSGLNALGIDTFDIVPSEEGLMQSSVTIGKHFYLVRNLLVTLTQSRDSRRFMVEVDIGKGLIFQAENQFGPDQSQQEGKFSLKWNKNY